MTLATSPPLRNGDHLTRAEFHRRYEAMGDGAIAELVEGIVYLWGTQERPRESASIATVLHART